MQIRGEFERQRRVEFQADGNEFAEIAQEGLHWFDIAVNYNNGSIKNKKKWSLCAVHGSAIIIDATSR